jgi:hypothetical protein
MTSIVLSAEISIKRPTGWLTLNPSFHHLNVRCFQERVGATDSVVALVLKVKRTLGWVGLIS